MTSLGSVNKRVWRMCDPWLSLPGLSAVCTALLQHYLGGSPQAPPSPLPPALQAYWASLASLELQRAGTSLLPAPSKLSLTECEATEAATALAALPSARPPPSGPHAIAGPSAAML
jgi:hypothetical protein